MAPETVTPNRARALVEQGARLIDIRGTDEHAREHIPGAVSLPLTAIETLPRASAPIVFHCRSGMRSDANAARLQSAAGDAPCYILAGGIEGWRGAGLPTRIDRRQPLDIMRQVQIAAGGLVLLGVLLGFLVTPVLFGLSASVGAGLVFAGASGWCGMATLLRHMPWNRRARAS